MITLFEGELASRDTLRFVEEKGGIGLWKWDLRKNVMTWSHGIYGLLGLELGEVEPSYERITAMIHPDDRLPPSEVERLMREGLPIVREFRVIQRGGRVRWLANRGEVLLDGAGQPYRAIGALFDISRQYEAIVAMRATEDRYQALVQAAGGVVWTSRADGTGADPEWLGLSGQTPDEALRAGWIAAVHPEDRTEVEGSWRSRISSPRPFEAECRLLADGEGYRWFQVRAAPVMTGGAVREWIWAGHDIHARKTNPLLHGDGRDGATPRQLTGAQIRAARGFLNWSVRDLSEASGVSPSVIRRLEEFNSEPNSPEPRMEDLRAAFEESGVEFLFPSTGKPAVRLK